MTWFRSGSMREIAEAIMRNDAPTVARLAPTLNVNKKGAADMTLLVLALRQLETTPQDHAILESLLAAKADPNLLRQSEPPLSIAIQHSGAAGTKPTQLLLDAGPIPTCEIPSAVRCSSTRSACRHRLRCSRCSSIAGPTSTPSRVKVRRY